MKLNIAMIALNLILLFGGLDINNLQAQDDDSPILFIYDASGSMWGKIGNETKKEAAANILVGTINKLKIDQKIGFMAYGHRSKSDCEDVELLLDLDNTDKSKLISTIKGITPLGKTPLAYSATMAIEKIKGSQAKATIILVTDGIESCNGDLCQVVRLAREEGIEFKLHIIGFSLKNDEAETLKCATEVGGGNYYNAEDAFQLEQVLDEAVHQKIDDEAPNHSFYTIKNGEPIDSWIKITNKDNVKEIRTVRTYKDTANIFLPNGNYQIAINPLEGTDIASKSLEIKKAANGSSHNTISFDGGSIEVYVSNNNEGWDAVVKVIDKQTKKIIASKRTYGRKQNIEVNTGNYDLELLPLKIEGISKKQIIEDISVDANKTNPVSYDYKTGVLAIGVKLKSGELVDATIRVAEIESNKNVAGGRTYTKASSNPKKMILQPGTYEIKIKTLGIHKGTTKTAKVTITADKQSDLTFTIN